MVNPEAAEKLAHVSTPAGLPPVPGKKTTSRDGASAAAGVHARCGVRSRSCSGENGWQGAEGDDAAAAAAAKSASDTIDRGLFRRC